MQGTLIIFNPQLLLLSASSQPLSVCFQDLDSFNCFLSSTIIVYSLTQLRNQFQTPKWE
jgi:hypothetical protein